ncbi:aminodeoxychorismate synthase, component I [Haloferax profundi]|uniref:anthranilate synthase n=1 Tax=Haloferax profundi TaxID=1544718 RepID=A0A0W1S905_9EURY|nr:aminodeoxychorismate synthase, component I [Haloferax profundi]KTG22585.1 anthranilate synthase [Haloferax profundi]
MSKPTVITDRDTYLSLATRCVSDVRIPIEVRISVEDPFKAYRRARSSDSHGFYLETTGGQSGWGYFGVDPTDQIEVRPDATTGESGTPSIDTIDNLVNSEQLIRGNCSVPYPCGGFGWLSYDIARELEQIPESTIDDRSLPNLQLGVFERIAAWREPKSGDTMLHITACPKVSEDPQESYIVGKNNALELADDVVDETSSTDVDSPKCAYATFESECGQSGFKHRVQRVKEFIHDGDTFQANISHRLSAPAAVHPVDAFEAVRRVNPAPYSGLLEFPGIDLVSASPELLLEINDGKLLTEPIAGTRPRGATIEEDKKLESELLSNEKERAEHAMLVDLERNDLGKVSEYGTVDVTEYRRVDRYSEVMHLVSLVRGQLKESATIGDAVAAAFPGGTITGAPKPRTMEIIDQMESTRRGPYTGSIGIFGFDDRATLNIIIRTLVRVGNQYQLRVGAGIVHDSAPEDEYTETLAKAQALVTAVDEALGEKAKFDVETEVLEEAK